MRGRYLGWLVAVLRAVALFLVVVEVGFRFFAPPIPPIQIVRPDKLTVRRSADGVPVWEVPSTKSNTNARCLTDTPVAPRIEAFGSSITFGVGATFRHDWPARLSANLAATGREPVCVVNRAQAGYTLDAKIATFHERFAEDHPAIVLWEVWENDGSAYRLLGDTAYALRDLRTDAEGWPDAFGIPPIVSHALFRSLRLYETLTLRFAPRTGGGGESWERMADRVAREVVRPSRAAGATVVIVTAVPLGTGFDAPPRPFETSFQAMADREGIAWVSLRELLADQRVEEMRADACCHLSDAGTERIGQRLAPLVRRLLDAPTLRGNLLKTAGR